jgi:PhnB protein
MTVTTTTHLNFTGNAREALEFYHSVFGGHLMIGTYGQGGVPRHSPDGGPVVFDPVAADSPDAEHVGFGMVATENGFRLAAYDVFGASGGGIAGSPAPRTAGLTHTESVFVLLNGDSYDELAPLWKGLAEGGTVISALPDGPSAGIVYGMLTDRFGVTWIFGVTPAH